ncbi:MAG: hypothetical protein CBC91_05775 [Rickettsiales bacterium TMED131]|nr:MAG: hypothetical protein CBC91_05775 [Rickettsiales bacterium TMED131]
MLRWNVDQVGRFDGQGQRPRLTECNSKTALAGRDEQAGLKPGISHRPRYRQHLPAPGGAVRLSAGCAERRVPAPTKGCQ